MVGVVGNEGPLLRLHETAEQRTENKWVQGDILTPFLMMRAATELWKSDEMLAHRPLRDRQASMAC